MPTGNLNRQLRDAAQAGHTALIEATSLGAMECLLKRGANPNATDNDGCTALHAVYIGILAGNGDWDAIFAR